jgi:hypothetical protein
VFFSIIWEEWTAFPQSFWKICRTWSVFPQFFSKFFSKWSVFPQFFSESSRKVNSSPISISGIYLTNIWSKMIGSIVYNIYVILVMIYLSYFYICLSSRL